MCFLKSLFLHLSLKTRKKTVKMLKTQYTAKKSLITMFKIILDEKLSENAEIMGKILRDEIANKNLKSVTGVRGKGLLSAILIHSSKFILFAEI